MKKCLLIYNPNSGTKQIEKYLPNIIKLLTKKEYDTEVFSTKEKGDATKIVETHEGVDLVMTFGGDGTFNEVMTGNFRRKEQLLLTHIPVGTTNDIGAMLGYNKDIMTNVKLSLNGIDKEIDIGLINKHPFIYVAGFGKYTNISYETPRDLKKAIGSLAYIKEGIVAFFRKTRLYDITYEIDGKEEQGLFSLILISNANHIAGIKDIYKDVKLDDNKLEVVFCTIKTRKEIFKAIYSLALNGPSSEVPGLYFYRTNNIKIKINSPEHYKPWCIDGEKLESSPEHEYKIEIPRIKARVRVPNKERNIKKLFTK